MLARLIKYFKTFDGIIQLQYGLRRQLLDLYHKCFKRHILGKLDRYTRHAINVKGTTGVLASILCLPDKIEMQDHEKTAIIKDADQTINGIYNILGSGPITVVPIDWHTDFKTGYRWPSGVFYKKYNQEDISTSSDVKIPRELSRCHHLLKVGLAYRLTCNEKYSAFCVSQIEDWIDHNPLMYSINWGCTMDVAIRAVNWIWTLGLIVDSAAFRSGPLKKIYGSLYQHGWFIYRNPEKELANNSNHYLSDLAGQIHLGLLFKGHTEPEAWLKKGYSELLREIRLQILPGGMSYERSTSYNRLVLELILVQIIILERCGYEVPADIRFRLEKMFEFIMYTLKPDGTSPIIGDQDNGRLLPFGIESINDFRYLLSIGALMFDRPDFKNQSRGFSVYNSLFNGNGACDRWNKTNEPIIDLSSKSFSDSGIYIMRNKGSYLLFNATGKGMYPDSGTGTHTHSDLLSFELYTMGKTFLVDPGSYIYTGDAYYRNLFRSTKMHNTVTIDSESQNHIDEEDFWDFRRDAIPIVTKWAASDTSDIISASHNGYMRLPDPVSHERTVIFDKLNEKWIIKDKLAGQGSHRFDWYFHFDTGIDFIISKDMVKTICSDNNIMLLFKHNSDLSLQKEKSFVSKSYGTKEDAFVLVATIKDTAPVELTTEIISLNQI